MFRDLTEFRTLLVALLDKGYIVAASRLGDDPASGYNNRGNQDAFNANAALYTYLTANYSINTSKVVMVGTRRNSSERLRLDLH